MFTHLRCPFLGLRQPPSSVELVVPIDFMGVERGSMVNNDEGESWVILLDMFVME